MMASKYINENEINTSLCRDPERIIEILRRDYFDAPICYFPLRLIRATAHWIAESDRLFLATVEVGGCYAGMIFGHTLGASIWKQFARAHKRYFLGLLWVWIRVHIIPWLRVHLLRKPRRLLNEESLAKFRGLRLPTLDRPFTRSPDDPGIGFTELSFVLAKYRGMGLAQHLRHRLCQEMANRGVRLIETHFDADNYPAVRSSLKNGFEIFKLPKGDYYGRLALTNVSLHGTANAQRASIHEPSSFSLVSAREEWSLSSFRNEWAKLLELSDNLDLLYQSPQWFDHLSVTKPDKNLMLGLSKDNSGHLVGVVPILIGQYTMNFDISARSLWKVYLHTAFILGSQPILPREHSLYDHVFKTISENLPECDCIYMDSVPKESFLWQYLSKSETIHGHCIIYAPDGFRPYHAITLPATFEEYLARFKRKTRYNLKRGVKGLREHAGGRLEMLRVDSENQIQGFLKDAVSVARNSWQQERLGTRIDNTRQWHAKLTDLAGRGLLRAYLLRCGDKPCAFALGYQFRDVYHYVEIAYDRSFEEFAPGTVLLYLVVEDLVHYNPPRRFNFGIGEAQYKQVFGNVHLEDASIFLLRRTFANRILRASHSRFRLLVRALRKRIRSNG